MKTLHQDLLKLTNWILLCSMALFVTSCVGIKQKGNVAGPSNNIYEVFYVGLDTVQYYIKPLPIQDIDFELSNENTMDATVRIVDNDAKNIRLTFTTFTKKKIQKDAILQIKGDTHQFSSNTLKVYFSEKKEEVFENRFEYTVPFKDFKKSINGTSVLFEFKSEEEINRFTSSKKMLSTFKKLRQAFF